MENHVTFLLLFLSITILLPAAAPSSCPINFTYVQTFPWNTSTCTNTTNKQPCCSTLKTIFHIGLSQYLKQSLFFQLPNENTSSICLSDFQEKLTTLSIHPSLVPSCFPNPSQFVTNSSTCAGVVTSRDWEQKVNSVRLSPMQTLCKDLDDQTSCNNCIAASLKVALQLTIDYPNATETGCFSFASLYAAAVVNPEGTTDVTTIGCIMGVQLSSEVAKGSSNKRGKVLKVVFTLLGAVVGVIILFVLMVVMYRKWEKRRKENVYHREIENGIRNSVLTNTDAITDWVWTLAESGKMMEIFDESIREGPGKIMERFVHVGMLCAHAMAALRPTIAEALKMLEGDTDVPKLPDRPVPLGHASFQSSLLHGLQGSGRSMQHVSSYS
ncbi:receptor-like protein [Vigna angularis]|uniref:Receptor-like protein n=1 Tax=Phaseolus angularis TaxID=3914 RepID=A0A8T0K170_PHAAN|nr:receptor-like protein [Vigna angularis]